MTHFWIILLLSLSGCAGFKSHKLADVSAEQAQSVATSKKHVFLDFRSSYSSNMYANINDKFGEDIFRAYIRDVFVQSKLFDSVTVNDSPLLNTETAIANSDLHIEITQKVSRDGNVVWELLSAATLTIIPSIETYSYAHYVRVSKNKLVLKEYVLRDRMQYVYELLFLPITPFMWPSTVEKDVIENMARNLLVHLSKDQLL